MNIQDRKKSLTAEDLRRRYNLDELNKDRKAIRQNGKDIESVGILLNNFAEITTRNIEELQDQVDGNITTWFYNGVPTLSNLPASEWTTDTDKNNHLGDLYYDQDTGYAYRFQKTNNQYSWFKLEDSDVSEALAIANAAQDTADSKRRVFVVQPIPPYDIGDIWIKEDKDLYRCKTAVAEGGTYDITHWILATDYTNDTVALEAKAELNQYKDTVAATYTSKSTFETTVDSIQSDITSIYQDYSTTTQMNSSINQKIADNNTAYVDIEVGKKVNNSDYTNAKITAKINDGTSSVKLSANKLDLTGYITATNLATSGQTTINGGNITTGTISASRLDSSVITTSNFSAQNINASKITAGTLNLTSNNIAINSTNFQVDKNGNITANNATFNSGTFKGTINTSQDCYVGNNLYVGANLSGNKAIALSPNIMLAKINYSNNDYLYITGDSIFEDTTTFGDDMYIGKHAVFQDSNGNTTCLITSATGDLQAKNIEATKKITAGNIDCGSGQCNSNGETHINFNKTFTSTPIVIATPVSRTNGVIALKITGKSTTGFDITIGGSGFPNNEWFDWIAMN